MMSKIFLHIPKCGGSTLNSLLRKNFPEGERFYVDPKSIADSRKKFREQSGQSRQSIQLLYGHLSYGWHELLPQEAVYFTIIRDPVARVVSHYNYVRFRSEHSHYLRETVERENMSIADYVTSGVCDEVNNGMVRLLAGVEDIVQEPYGESRLPYGANDPDLLDQALENIERHFAVVGLQERFDESLLLLRKRLGIKQLTYRRRNTGRQHYKKMRPTPEDVDAIRDYNQLDQALYEQMKHQFETMLDSLSFKKAQLASLRFSNVAKKYYRGTRKQLGVVRRSIVRSS